MPSPPGPPRAPPFPEQVVGYPFAVVRYPFESVGRRWPPGCPPCDPGPPPGESPNGPSALPGLLLPFSHTRYCEFNENQANELRSIVFWEMEFLERLSKTTFTNAKHSIRNTDCWLCLQYLRCVFGISQISQEVLQKYVKVSVWSGGCCIL